MVKTIYIEVLYSEYASVARKQYIIHSGMARESRYDNEIPIGGEIVRFRVMRSNARFLGRLSDSASIYKRDNNLHFPENIIIFRTDRFMGLFINSVNRFDSASIALLNHMLETYSQAVEAATRILDQKAQFREEIRKYVHTCLLYLVLQTYDTPTAKLLTEDAMAMCLLDMVQTTIKDIHTVNPTLYRSKVFYIINPVFSNDSYMSNLSVIIDCESLRAITTSSNLPEQLIQEAEYYAIKQVTEYCNRLEGHEDPITTHKVARKMPLLVCSRRQGPRLT